MLPRFNEADAQAFKLQEMLPFLICICRRAAILRRMNTFTRGANDRKLGKQWRRAAGDDRDFMLLKVRRPLRSRQIIRNSASPNYRAQKAFRVSALRRFSGYGQA